MFLVPATHHISPHAAIWSEFWIGWSLKNMILSAMITKTVILVWLPFSLTTICCYEKLPFCLFRLMKGVPRVWVQGPVRFTISINNIISFITNLNVHLWAVDTVMFCFLNTAFSATESTNKPFRNYEIPFLFSLEIQVYFRCWFAGYYFDRSRYWAGTC